MNDVFVHACPVSDELVTDEGAVVLISVQGDHRVLRLSVLGQLIRELAVDGITVEQLVVELESWIGSAPGGNAAELVRHAVDELQKDGLLALRSPDQGETLEGGTKRD